MTNLTDVLIQHADFLVAARGRVSDAIALLGPAAENQQQRADAWGWNHPSIKLGAAISTEIDDLNQAVVKGWISLDAPLSFFAARWQSDIQQELQEFATHCAKPAN